MDAKVRTRAEIVAQLQTELEGVNSDIIDALATLKMTDAELISELRARYPSAPDDVLQSYARDAVNDASAAITGEIDADMFLHMDDEPEPLTDWMPDLPTY